MMTSLTPPLERSSERGALSISIGGTSVVVRSANGEFLRQLEARYAGFVQAEGSGEYVFDIELSPASDSPDADIRVRTVGGRWVLERGDFRATFDPATRHGHIRQTANPYSLDSALRIVHSVALADCGGFLIHSASAIRNRRAVLFAGISGAGKTTISRLAPPDAVVLTDEISYVRPREGYTAYGTPFAGELGNTGQSVSAPIAAVYLLAHGPYNRIEDVSRADAVRALMRNILFFAEDAPLVRQVFHSVCLFVERVPVKRLTFWPDRNVWSLIQ